MLLLSLPALFLLCHFAPSLAARGRRGLVLVCRVPETVFAGVLVERRPVPRPTPVVPAAPVEPAVLPAVELSEEPQPPVLPASHIQAAGGCATIAVAHPVTDDAPVAVQTQRGRKPRGAPPASLLARSCGRPARDGRAATCPSRLLRSPAPTSACFASCPAAATCSPPE